MILFYLCSKTKEMKVNLFGYSIELRRTTDFYNPVVHREGFFGFDLDGFGTRERLPFADGEMKSVLLMITNRMANAEWHAAEGDPTQEGGHELMTVTDLFAMVERYALFIVWRLFRYGFCDFDAATLLPCGVEDRRSESVPDNWRGVKERVVRVYDDVYLNTGKTRAVLLAPALSMLDTVNNADLNLIDNYGAMGLLSPENGVRTDGFIDDEEYKKLQEDYHKVHGVKFGRWALMITKQAVKYQPIELPIKALELSAKRKAAVASILQALDIPKELHALFESAKFLNMQEAERSMYSSCVTHWCEVMVRVMTDLYNRHRLYSETRLPDNEFWFDFVGVPALQEAQAAEAKRTRDTIDYLFTLLEQNLPADKKEYIEKRINDLTETI